MYRSYALSLGGVAMAVVAFRGALRNELAAEVAIESIMALILFGIAGAVVGAIADHLIRGAVETQYRQRVAWFGEQQERRHRVQK